LSGHSRAGKPGARRNIVVVTILERVAVNDLDDASSGKPDQATLLEFA
jgi:hypothetical protein